MSEIKKGENAVKEVEKFAGKQNKFKVYANGAATFLAKQAKEVWADLKSNPEYNRFCASLVGLGSFVGGGMGIVIGAVRGDAQTLAAGVSMAIPGFMVAADGLTALYQGRKTVMEEVISAKVKNAKKTINKIFEKKDKAR